MVRAGLLKVVLLLLRMLQGLADHFRMPPDSPSDETAQNAILRTVRRGGGFLLRFGRMIVSPATRNRLRWFAVKLSGPRVPLAMSDKSNGGRVDGLDFSGINLVGYLSAEIGLGEGARSTLRAAKTAGIDVSCFDFRAGCSARFLERIDCENSSDRSYAVNLFHLNPDQLLVAYVMLGKGFFDKHFNIIYCVWEQSEFPDDWIPAFELVDEVWTPSTFCAEVIGHRIDKPVIPIPHNVEPVAAENLDRGALGLPKEAFLFLGMLDCYSTPERKNPLASLEAYVCASSESSRESYFVLKVLNSHAGKELLLSVKRYQARCPRILVIDKYLSRREVSGLMQACDCFVSLHRCEGFGLTIAEAMCLGKPVIATGWSGNMDFMSEENSLPVRYELVELKHSIGPYRKGYFWAEPDVDHAAKLMRSVMDCPGIADSIGKRGREKIKSDLSASKTGHLMRQRLQEIGLVFSADRLDSRDPLIGTQDCSS